MGTSRQAPLEPSLGKMRLHQILRQIGKAKAGQRRIEYLRDAVEDELPIDAHLQLAAALLKLPGVQPAIGRQAQIDAVVVGQVLRRLWAAVASRNTMARRRPPCACPGPMRTAIMSFATCSPRRTPAS